MRQLCDPLVLVEQFVSQESCTRAFGQEAGPTKFVLLSTWRSQRYEELISF